MRGKKGQRGMTVIETLIVVAVVCVLAGIAGLTVSRFNASRSINDIARNISSTLQMAKMKSARDGVEYRAVFSRCNNVVDGGPDCKVCTSYTDFGSDDDDDTLTITLERGNSNKGSTKWCIVSSQTKKMNGNFNLDLTDMDEITPIRCGFGPRGFMVDKFGQPVTRDANDPVLMSITPTSTSRVSTCGIVELSPPLGMINVVRGNWDGTDCNPIRETSPIPTP